MSTVGRHILPFAAGLLVLLVVVTAFAAQSGIHMQDGMYSIGATDPDIARIVAPDDRFTVTVGDGLALWEDRFCYDVVILQGEVYVADTEKGRSALKSLERVYEAYVSSVAAEEPDLFAAYPLWIDLQYVKSEVDFAVTESRQRESAQVGIQRPSPASSDQVEVTPRPQSTIPVLKEDFRENLADIGSDNPLLRYTSTFSGDQTINRLKVPSQISPPLPFDSIILVFVFIFPLYFTSQFFMMSVMNERVGRAGEPLLSAPIRSSAIVIGKALPYFCIMLLISAAITLFIGAPLGILVPLVPIILFFLASALIISMAARSFKELSFVSIFFSTLVTTYLFFPTVFANTHVMSIVSPLTLIVLVLQGDGFTLSEYLYSTTLFFATSAILFYIGTVNYREEELFSTKPLASRLIDFVSGGITRTHPYFSLFLLAALSIPFVFMIQMMALVLFFNIPMPISIVLLIVSAAIIEEFAKSIGIYAVVRKYKEFLTPKSLIVSASAIGLGFLVGEKLLLFATLTQISESIFGSVLFLSLGLLWMPLLLHILGVLITGGFLFLWGRRAYAPGIIVASVVHSLYNLYFIMGGAL